MKLINLLPKKNQSFLRQEVFYRNFLALIWITVFLFAVGIVLQFLAHLYLIQKAQATRDSIAQLKQQVDRQDNAKIKAEITRVNNYINDFKDLSQGEPHWSKVLKAFAPIPPAGVKVTTFSVDSSRGLVAITGYAPTRELVIQLYNSLVGSKDFENVDYPLDNVARPTDVNFHFSFTLKSYLLK